MMYLKKYFTEGLIQIAILLSLCGVRVDVGLEPYLPSSWHEMILGPTLALTQTQFHNLRNHLEEGHGLHTKNVDLDGFFTTRRLLGWVRSLDRVQVPHTELETWLVQREPDSFPIQHPDQPSLLERASVGVDRSDPFMESIAGLGIQQEDMEVDDEEEGTRPAFHYRGHLDARGEQEEDEDEELARMQRHYRRMEGEGRRPGASYSHTNNRQFTQNELDQTTSSLQECLRLLEETFPFAEDRQLSDVGGRMGDLTCQHPGSQPQLYPNMHTDNPSLDLERTWQDLFAIIEPENMGSDMITSFDHTQDPRPSETLWGTESDALHADQRVHPTAASQQHGLLSLSQSEPQPALLPLTPSAELDDNSSTFNTRAVLKNPNVNTLLSPPDHTDLLGEDSSENFSMGQNTEDNSSTLNINLLGHDLVDNLEGIPPLHYALYPNDLTQDPLTSPSNVLLVDEDDVGDDDGLPSPINDLLEDSAILDEIRLLDLALEEGFSPQLAARLEEEGYLDSEIAKQDTGKEDDSPVSSMAVREDRSEPTSHQQDGEDEADSDSGLSLDFSHSPASPCNSEASYYSSSSASSTSSSSCGSTVESLFYEDKDEDPEEGLVDSDMEMKWTIKQEVEEEEMGAVGGGYPENVKLFANYGNQKLLNGFPWLEHINHDHTYNQPQSSISSPPLDEIPTKPTKPSSRRHTTKHFHYSSSRHISETKMWSRDERRARALKVPFSNELIVNLPVEEFNDLLTSYQLSEEQLALVKDIRRRGKNKIAAQNCRKRKMDVLTGLEDNVSGLKRHRLRLLREKQEALRNLQEMKRQLSTLYQQVFSSLRDVNGRPLDPTEFSLHFEPNGSVTVVSRQQEAELPMMGERTRKTQRSKKK